MTIPHAIENIGWTLGNDCPYRCPHCYSTIVRNRGRNLTTEDVDRIVDQLAKLGVRTVNLGGNEPIFTGGPNPQNTVLPHIIRSLHEVDIKVGLTTAGITLTYLERFFPDSVLLLNDLDISLDSPFKEEHNKNRGAALFTQALKAVEICKQYEIPRTFVMCGMNWNLSDNHLDKLIEIAREHDAFVRINFMKPTEPQHMELVPDRETFYNATRKLFTECKAIEMGEPLAVTVTGKPSRGCPCGTKSFRIHSITPDGRVPVSPCVYAHDYKVGDLLTDELADIVTSPQFEAFRKRRANPETIEECRGCEYLQECRGGCPSRAYLWRGFEAGTPHTTLSARDPYCLKTGIEIDSCAPPVQTRQDQTLVHRDYLCTLILEPA